MSSETTVREGKSIGRWLRWILFLLPFFLPLYVIRFKIGSLPTTLLEIFFGFFVVSYLWERSWRGFQDGWDRIGLWRWPVVAWLGAGWFAAFVAPDTFGGIGLWRAYFLEPILLFVMLADLVRVREDADRLRRALFLSVVPLMLIALAQFTTGRWIPSPWDVSIAAGRRATGPFPFPNALALYVTPIGAWAFVWWLHRRKDALAVLTWVSALLAILLAKSDGGLVAFGVVALIGMFLQRRSRKVAVALLVLLGLSLVAIPSFRQSIWTELSFQGWSGKVRTIMWKETWTMLKDRPILGAGLGGYPEIFKPYHRATAIEIFQYPHTILLNFWSEMGVLGLIVFGWILYLCIRCTAKNSESRSDHFLLLAPLIALLIHGLVDVPYFKNDLAMLFWILIFLTAIPCLPDRSLTEPPSSDRMPSR